MSANIDGIDQKSIMERWDIFDTACFVVPPDEFHAVGALDCGRCYSGTTIRACSHCKTGRIHTEAYYDDDGDLLFWNMCDKCGWEDFS